MTARIQIKLSATLKRYTPPAADDYPIQEGFTVRELLDRLGIPLVEVNLAFVSGKKANLDAPLADGDQVSLFPPLGGG